ncbi:hypothetical protein MtrunA17_Chr2g0304861 [Medicago truncatula]|uniref:Uncharacterized protein n=1 Tax=Medicago truncatula TaxID=3880 RepID=A0A396JCG9_MEDTR|nr:hypothetical protein MtrunA17_Chr2g0304861 [Medicago truncatula]
MVLDTCWMDAKKSECEHVVVLYPTLCENIQHQFELTFLCLNFDVLNWKMLEFEQKLGGYHLFEMVEGHLNEQEEVL